MGADICSPASSDSEKRDLSDREKEAQHGVVSEKEDADEAGVPPAAPVPGSGSGSGSDSSLVPESGAATGGQRAVVSLRNEWKPG